MDNGLGRAIIAANRFGLGAGPGEIEDIAHDPKEWVLAQLEQPEPPDEALLGLQGSPEYLARFKQYRRERRAARQQDEQAAVPKFGKRFNGDMLTEIQLRARQQCGTASPVHERLVMFWSNHFTVSAEKQIVRLLAGAFEREAIRPHISDDFATLLLSAEQHPAMLLYLDNVSSIGPGARMGRKRNRRAAKGRGKPAGINENLAREAMELHSLGVDGGYRQQDVLELARALTGWRTRFQVPDRNKGQALTPHGSVFQHHAHEPGSRKLLGKTFSQRNATQGRAMLRYLADQPATAAHVATALARHYVDDDPPRELVEHLAKAYRRHEGRLLPVYRALFTHELAWQEQPRKFRRPDEYLVALHRALGELPAAQGPHWKRELQLLGQRAFRPGSPAGWGDTADDWIGADALWKRLLIAQQYAEQLPRERDPMELAQDSLGPTLQESTAIAISQSGRRQGAAIVLASPEFQWR
ncbi:DUF1800 domain-containing protein [Halomonas eurihalina]|uniref:DUF1800 domain-containing protein n=1 Tax=Halomonas eurihalina TaxID=42566 RepID=A0A5D9CLF7_HALER|nr:DUF1800 domain-containing protein [Halomonas eurihalina]MDR5860321.1 DUF1800 domain-containing protein [Halomonas eurihalina]TZG32033.1 DUF1800 domain-containing protein [Halomonas eurihalina]